MGYLKDELAIKLPYGNKIQFNKEDGVWRTRDTSTGMWIRYGTFLDGSGNPRKGYGSNGELIGEGIDQHFVTTNGLRVFMFPKKEKVKK